MAGGMHPKPGSLTLAERAELSRRARAPSAPAPPDLPGHGGDGRDDRTAPATAPVQEAGGGGRHCWVSGLPGQPGRWPGLLVAWARQEAGWSGRVVYAVVDDDQVILVETWVSAEHLRPAST